MNSKEKFFSFPSVSEFNFSIKLSQTDEKTHLQGIDFHTHDECEIYINLTGNVSFMVENSLYPITSGDVIIVRPGQYHHCVYHSNSPHKRFWILFSCKGNENILDLFFKDPIVNFISPDDEAKKELINLCYSLNEDNLSDTDKYIYFFRIMSILKSSSQNKSSNIDSMPPELTPILEYIDSHISENLQIEKIASAFYTSQSTIQRQFLKYLGINPMEFIRKKRLNYASELLRSGTSVLNAGLEAGYLDNSHFIKLFKQYFGITPYQYKKKHNN